MGPTPAKVGRINDRDTQTTGPDPWSNVAKLDVKPTPLDLGSVINDCESKHYNTVDGKGIPERWLKTRRQLPA